MKTIVYAINMYTPIGVRHGMMSATMIQDKIMGTIEILEHSGPFEGTVEEDGNCTIKGSIKSLMKTIEYIATGKITRDDICLQLQSKKNTFRIMGVASMTEGEKEYE